MESGSVHVDSVLVAWLLVSEACPQPCQRLGIQKHVNSELVGVPGQTQGSFSRLRALGPVEAKFLPSKLA